MEIRMLRYFLTVANEQSISQAARVLHITQPTLSRQIKDFEDKLGTDLFVRQNKKMLLTEAGLFLKKRAEEILYLNDATEQEFLEQREGALSGHLAIGCVEADNSTVLAQILGEMLAEHPQITFRLFSGIGDDILEKLDKGLLDAAILIEPVSTDKYEKIILPVKERWGLLVSTDTELATKKQITKHDLLKVPLLCSNRTAVEDMLYQWAQCSAEDLKIVGRYNLIFNIFALVQNQIGAALTIEGVVANRKIETITFVPFYPEIETHCVLVWKKNTILSPTVHAFIEKFKHAFKA